LTRKPGQSAAGRWLRQACSQREAASDLSSTSRAGSAFELVQLRRISRRLARWASSRASCSARAIRSARRGSVRKPCSNASISARAWARASLPFLGIIAARSQLAIAWTWAKRCRRDQWRARSS